MSRRLSRLFDKYVFKPMRRRMAPRRHRLYENIISLLIGISAGLIVSTPLIIRACDGTPTIQTISQPAVYALTETEIQVMTITADKVPEAPEPATETPDAQAPEEQPQTSPEPETVILSETDMDYLARCIEAEASGEGLYGKQLVADVILNRVSSSLFPGTTITEIVLQYSEKNGVWQFSVAGNGMLESAVPTQETYDAIALELEHRTNTDILYFTSEGFSPYGTPWQKVGNHYFSTAKLY